MAIYTNLLVFICFSQCFGLSPYNIYVSTSGSDSNPGTQTAPFQTIARAQQEVRSIKQANGGALNAPANVLIASGVYRLTAPIALGAADSGNAQFAVTYTAWPGTPDVPVIVGSVAATGWTRSQNASVWQAKVHQMPADGAYFREMFVNGRRATLARTPVLTYKSVSSDGFTIDAQPGQIPGKGPSLYNIKDTQVVTYENWIASVHPIASINFAANTVTLATNFNQQWASADGSRYYFENVLEALDQPGEFYYDRTSQVLSYIPLPDEDLATADVELPWLLELVNTAGGGVQYVTLTNLTFSYTAIETASCFSGPCNAQSADFLTTATIHLTSATYVTLNYITVSHVGGYAVWFDVGASYNQLTSSHLTDLGAGAVRVGQGNPQYPVTGNVVSDNVLEDGGHYYQEGCGVLAQQVAETTIVHNTIYDFLYTGVSVGWTWGYAPTPTYNNTVGWNSISLIGQGVLSDMGCIYTLGHQPGTVITTNICHDVQSYGYGGWGLYTDEGSWEIEHVNNLVYHTKCAGFHQHYGVKNYVHNNIYADVDVGGTCDGGVRSSQHPGQCVWPGTGEDQGRCSSFMFEHNIVYVQSGSLLYDLIPTGFNNMTMNYNTYWCVAEGTNAQFNGTSFAVWESHGKDQQSVVADPLFVDPANLNFALRPDSPALKLGFVPIDFSTVGPRTPTPP